MNLSTEKFKHYFEQKSEGSGNMKDEFGAKFVTEEESQSDGESSIKNKNSINDSSFQFEGVRFTPRLLEFLDAFEGKQFVEKLTIQNVGKNPVSVRIGEPSSFIFQIKKPSRRAILLAAGASITKTVFYTYHNDDMVQKSRIPMQINGRLLEYPIVVKKAVPDIDVRPSKLDFKIINLGSSVKSMILSIHNSGGKRTRFEIDVGKNDLDLVVTPLRGTIRAKNQVSVLVEIMGLCEGEYFKELWITTNEMSIRVPVMVEVVRPRLEIVYPNGTEDITLINFNSTFYNTQKVRTFVLKNYSAEATLFIAVAEVNGELMYLKDARKSSPIINMFGLTAEEGRLEPFECRVLTVLFRPKNTEKDIGWHDEEYEKKKKNESELIAFFRINRVHCVERKELVKVEFKSAGSFRDSFRDRSTSVMPSTVSFQSSNTPADSRNKVRKGSDFVSEIIELKSVKKMNSFAVEPTPPSESILRLCLHGKAVEPNILIQPSELDFATVMVGETGKKVLRITNNNPIPIKYKFKKVMNMEVVPKECWLRVDEAKELSVILVPSNTGEFQRVLKVEFLAESEVVLETDKKLDTILTTSVSIHYNVKGSHVILQPKPTLGITPLITDEIGLQKDFLTFKNHKYAPYAAVLLSQKIKPEWMIKEPNKALNVKNALMALPNDRSNAFYSWPKERICRTVFKGLFRYSPPKDPFYTLTTQETLEKKQNYDFWKNYLSSLRKLRIRQNENMAKKSRCLPEYEVACPDHLNFKYSLKPITTILKEERKLFDFNKYMDQDDAELNQALVPLSPMYLSNINVKPKLINFSTVAVNNEVQEMLNIENLNDFPISIRFMPGKNAVSVLEGTIIVHSMVTQLIPVSFQTKKLGRYYGFLNYVINGSHEFKITISAFVTPKTLVFDTKDTVLEFGNYPKNYAFQPRSLFVGLENLLHSPIKYQWHLPFESVFVAEVTEGEVSSRTKLMTEILLDLHPGKVFEIEANLMSESGSTETIKMVHHNKKVPVSFVTSRIDMENVSLNLPTFARPIIRNDCYHDVVFEVSNWVPMPGVFVEPTHGVIKARSFFPLEIKIQIPVIMKFAFDVLVTVHNVTKIVVKVSGNVVVPTIRIRPAEIVMRKICAQSFDSITICVENDGTTPADIAIDFKSCPEYKIVDNNTKVFLLPGEGSKFVIRFEPENIARYVFYLPIIINKILGPPMMQEPATENLSFYIATFESSYKNYGDVFPSRNSSTKIPCACINCTVSSTLLRISSLNIDFCHKPNSYSEFQPQKLVISNDYVDEVTFCIRNDDLGEINSSPFALIPLSSSNIEYRLKSLKSTLKKGEKSVFEAKFRPKKPGHYSVDVPIFIKGYNNGTVFNFIHMVGEMKKPRLFTECSEIHFPPLPLGIGCDAIISICAENYYSPDIITCFVWSSPEGGEAAADYLTITWLQKPSLKTCKGTQVFQMLVNFRSAFPIGARNYLVFFDSKGDYCTVLVTATADNSAVTTHAFLATKASKYKLIRDTSSTLKWYADDEFPSSYPVNKADLRSAKKGKKGGSKTILAEGSELTSFNKSDNVMTSSACTMAIDKGPRLVIQVTKSMSRPTQLSFVNLTKNASDCKTKGSSSTALNSTKSRILNASYSPSDSNMGDKIFSNGLQNKKSDPVNEVTHPSFPIHDNLYGKHFQNTLVYVERWMFEVVMRCDQYFTIPTSFQKVKFIEKLPLKSTLGRKKSKNYREEKDFLDFLEEIIRPTTENIYPKRFLYKPNKCPLEKANLLHSFFGEILRFLQCQGCLLPHVKPEFLLDYENYLNYYKTRENFDSFKWRNFEVEKISSLKTSMISPDSKMREKNSRRNSSVLSSKDSWKKTLFENYMVESELDVGRQEEGKMEDGEPGSGARPPVPTIDFFEEKEFVHKNEILDKSSFESRTKQAWLDVIIQIFRNFFLKKITYKSSMPPIQVIEPSERLHVESADLNYIVNKKNTSYDVKNYFEPYDNNLYTIQERILLSWLNYHYNYQKQLLGEGRSDMDLPSNGRMINNFDKDLADSLALISVTASHCPYIVSEYFSNIFLQPDNLSKMYHNAGKLITAWRMLNVGLTVETADIVKPNPVFMIMLVVQLYEVLPNLHPRSLICFSSPLTKETTRTILLKNSSPYQIFYEPKFLGEYKGVFRLEDESWIELKPFRTTEINVVFKARKIKKVSATLILSGCVVSPNFARDLAFYLEGNPSDLLETDKFSFSAPLYRLICTELFIKSPYPEPATFEIWYTTEAPTYQETLDISVFVKPWALIWNRKVSRRLFLNKSEITIGEKEKPDILGITMACFTEKTRYFWLLFRNPNIGDFICKIVIKTKLRVPQLVITDYYKETLSPTTECTCLNHKINLKHCDSNSPVCPFLIKIKVPTRNEFLWKTLKSMFLKTLQPQEKTFWAEHFEMNIGICLILWLLSAEEEAVVEEFVHALNTRVSYSLRVEAPMDKYVTIPENIVIPDVRENSEFVLPIHISKSAPPKLKLILTMISENGTEVRNIRIIILPSKFQEKEVEVDKRQFEETKILKSMCQPYVPCNKKKISQIKIENPTSKRK